MNLSLIKKWYQLFQRFEGAGNNHRHQLVRGSLEIEYRDYPHHACLCQSIRHGKTGGV